MKNVNSNNKPTPTALSDQENDGHHAAAHAGQKLELHTEPGTEYGRDE
jgi:hypothetical protein